MTTEKKTEVLLNIIHLPETLFQKNTIQYNESVRRKQSFEKEMKDHGVEYKVWDAVYHHPPIYSNQLTKEQKAFNMQKMAMQGCMQSHKMIVNDARRNNLPVCCIGEDDIKFFALGAWDYFLKQMPETFDLYLGTSYSLHEYPNGKVDKLFDSMILYVISARFYDEFLELSEENHLDRQLSALVDKKDFRICLPYVCKQIDGYSFIAGINRDFGYRMAEKQKFGISS